MLALIQYFIYIITGVLYYFLLASFFAVAAGFGIWVIVLLLLTLLLAGYVSGMSLFLPRTASALGGTAAFALLIYGVGLVFEYKDYTLLVVVIPALVAVIISLTALRRPTESLWSRCSTVVKKTAVAFAAAIPALLTTWVLLIIIRNIGIG